jgi:hypothetical protein
MGMLLPEMGGVERFQEVAKDKFDHCIRSSASPIADNFAPCQLY